MLVLRSAIKMVMLYIFQGFPFLLALLSILVTQKARAGYDIFVKTYVEDLRAKVPQNAEASGEAEASGAAEDAVEREP
jgi:hypothetical protein